MFSFKKLLVLGSLLGVATAQSNYEGTAIEVFFDNAPGGCGFNIGPNTLVLFLSEDMFAENLCNKTVAVEYDSQVQTIKIGGPCATCSGTNVALSEQVFSNFGAQSEEIDVVYTF
ncbi:hypothetical protein HMN09_00853200 [Mycena chlorophos]|uniref:Barwin-like endoglucanase n=1 Tax=Mycena chlorophos TaxID=658473 RepID=A0A8H6SS60_MYCCL|nr:hypothetical protein HMN09_00853200 [Mycena chlorophos]